MRKVFFIVASLVLQTINKTYADTGLFWSCVSEWDIREWNIHTENIPCIIKSAIDFLMWLAWTIAVIFVIVWAYKILFWSLEQDKTKWKDTIFMAIWGFVLASLAWVIIKVIIDNLS